MNTFDQLQFVPSFFLFSNGLNAVFGPICVAETLQLPEAERLNTELNKEKAFKQWYDVANRYLM